MPGTRPGMTSWEAVRSRRKDKRGHDGGGARRFTRLCRRFIYAEVGQAGDFPSSWPDLFRPSTSCLLPIPEVVDARHKAGHDELGGSAFHSSWPGIAVQRTACFRTPMSRPSTSYGFAKLKTWMPGIKPGMTVESALSVTCHGRACPGHPGCRAGYGRREKRTLTTP
jgi:hypothetical protein